MRSKQFDPLEYIENAFLDTRPGNDANDPGAELKLPSIGDYLNGNIPGARIARRKYRKTEMSAPRPRRKCEELEDRMDPALKATWESLPKSVAFLCNSFDDAVTSNYYQGEFKESRLDLVKRILDPELTLEETSRLLGVCPATVRRYTNRNWLAHHRTSGGQRRFRLSSIVTFVEQHGRYVED